MASALRRRALQIFTTSLFLCPLVTLPKSEARAENFRIETKIYVDNQKKPESETTTLFQDGTVYDFLKSPIQTAVFSKPRAGKPGRFILLDPSRKTRTEIDTEKLTLAMEKLQTLAGRQTDPFVKFAADPKFNETYDSTKNQLVLASYLESYKVETTPAEHADAMVEYREFLDWYTQLNTLLQGNPVPPNPRLKLNEALTRHQVLPLKVELTHTGEKKAVRAEHDFTWLLSRDDEKRIDDVSNALFGYRQVTNEEFNRAVRPQEANGK